MRVRKARRIFLANILSLLFLAVAFLNIDALPVIAQTKDIMNAPKMFYIEAQSLRSALEAYERVSGINLAYSDELVEGKMTNGVQGKNTPAQALKKILKGTGLTYVITGQGTVVLKKAKMVVSQREEMEEKEVEEKEEEVKRPVEIEEMVVTATRTEREIKDVPASVSVVNEEDIKKKGAYSLRTALEGEASIHHWFASEGSGDTIQIRGLGRGMENSNIMVMIDGVPQVMVDERTILDQIFIENVERIEVVKGPASALYGRNAVGGTINIITKEPPSEWRGAVNYTPGKWGRHKPQFSMGGPVIKGKWFTSLGGSYETWNGWRDRTERDAYHAFIKNSFWYSDMGKIGLNFSYTKADQEIAIGIPVTTDFQVLDVPHESNFALPGTARVLETFRTNFTWDHQFSNSLKVKNIAYYRYIDLHQDSTGGCPMIIGDWLYRLGFGGDHHEHTFGFEPQVTWDSTLFGRPHTLTFGASYERHTGDEIYWFLFDTKTPKFKGLIPINYKTGEQDLSGVIKMSWANCDDFTENLGAFYIQDEFRLTDKLTITPGIRYDYYKRDMHFEPTDMSPVARELEGSFSSVSPKFGINYAWTPDLSTYFSYGHAFHPAMGMICMQSPRTVELDPESADNWEVGIKSMWFDRKLMLNSSFWYMRRYDAVTYTPDPDIPGMWMPVNAGKEEILGVELETKLDLSDWLDGLKVFANYTYTEKEWLDYVTPTGIDCTGKTEVNHPKHLLTAGIKYIHKPSGLGGGLTWHYVGSQYYDELNTFKLTDYFTMDARLSYTPPGKFYELSVIARNLTDEDDYITSFSGGFGLVPMTPFEVYGTITVKFPWL